MKVRVHIIGALFGCVCAVAFSLAPFIAGAEVGPMKVSAPKARDAAPNAASPRKHMHRGGVAMKDDGCGG